MRRFAQRRPTRKIVQYVKYNIPDRNNGERAHTLTFSLYLRIYLHLSLALSFSHTTGRARIVNTNKVIAYTNRKVPPRPSSPSIALIRLAPRVNPSIVASLRCIYV